MSSQNKQLTSLSLQLKKLQVPQAQTLLNADNKRRVSFLYDPKEAANLDSESVFYLALNGLEQLKLIDERVFSTFEDTLFNSTSITFERSIQTKELNDNLNSEIKRFLIHLSPYFLLKPSHKTLEWLVYKYQIHYYNINDLMMCILPYYENQLFIRAIQMISNLEQNLLWAWLVNNQKSGVPLASQTLAQHVVSDLSFLNFLVEYSSECLSTYRIDDISDDSTTSNSYLSNGVNLLTSFLTKTFIQALNSVKTPKLNDAFISQFLPFLYYLLKYHQPIECKNSAYLIITILFQKFTFNDESCEKTMISLIKSLLSKSEENKIVLASVTFKTALIACCLLVKSQIKSKFRSNDFYQSCAEVNKSGSNYISRSFLKKLLKIANDQDELLNYLSDLKHNYDIEEFIKLFFDRLLQNLINNEADHEQSEILLVKFVSKISFHNEANNDKSELFLKYMIQTLFYHLARLNDDENKEENSLKINAINELLKIFERKYPLKFDSVLKDLLDGGKLSDELKQKLQSSINFYTINFKTAFKYNYLSDHNANLTVCLQHSNDHIRASSLEYIYKYFESNSEIDEEFVKSQLKLKLDDRSLHVLKVLLKFKLNLLKFFSFQELTTKLITNLFYNSSENEMEVDGQVVEDDEELFDVRKLIISFIFDDLYLNLVKTTDKDNLKQQYCEILTNLVLTLFQNFMKTTKQQQICELFNCLAETKFLKQNENLFNFIIKNQKENNNLNKVIGYYNKFKDVLIKNFKEFVLNNLLSDISQDGETLDRLDLKHFFKFDLLIQINKTEPSIKIKEKIFSSLKSFESKVNHEKKQPAFLKMLKSEDENHENQLNEYISAIDSNKIDLVIYIKAFKSFLKSIGNQDEQLIEEIYEYLCIKSSNRNLCFIYLIQYFIKSHLNEKDKLLQFLLKFVSNKNKDGITNQVLIIRSIQLININFLTKEDESHSDLAINLVKNSSYIHQLVILLTSNLTNDNESIRIEALNCLSNLKTNLQHESIWGSFLKKMIKNSEEIKLDSTYLTGDAEKRCQLNKYLNTEILDIVVTFMKANTLLISECLSLFRNISSDFKFQLINFVISYISGNDKTDNVVLLLFKHYLVNEKTALYFNSNESIFENVILKNLSHGINIDNLSAFLNQLVKQEEFFTKLNQNLKFKLVDKMFSLYEIKQDQKQQNSYFNEIQSFFFNLVNDSNLFNSLLEKVNPNSCIKETTAKTTKELKKQVKTTKAIKVEANGGEHATELIHINLNKLRTLIELIQLKLNNNGVKQIENKSSLLKLLFENLNYIFEKQVDSDLDEQNEYIQLSILDSILEIYKSNKNSNSNEFNIELLIQILKQSQNIRVQQKILLLLSELASKYPDKILENVLVMFVFVGNKLIRKDDLYSLNIITKTINTIIPEILKAKTMSTSSNFSINPIVCKIVQSFAITLPYIPNHRKTLIFNDLLNIIGKDTYLWVIILQLFDYYFIENKKAEEKNDKKFRDTLKQCSQILSMLFNQFDFECILQSTIYLIEFLNKLDYNTPKEGNNKMVEYEFLNIKVNEYSTLERKYLIYNLTQLINELLVSNFSSTSKQNLFENLIEHLLIGIINLNKKQQQVSTNEDDLKFLKAILNKYYDCMENLILNLNISLFINIIRKLIKHEQLQIKRRILVLLNNKLRKQEYIDDTESIQLLSLIDDLVAEIKIDTTQQQVKLSNEVEINNQTILFTIKLLSKRIGDKNSIAFMKVLKYLCENLINKNLYLITDDKSKLINQNFLASVLLCIGELCSKLKSSTLVYLNQVVNFIFDIIDLDEILNNDLLVLSSITCLFKISQNLSNFLSPYLKRLINISCTLQYKKILQDQLISSSISKNSFSHQNISISSDIGMEIDSFLNQTNITGTTMQQSKSMQQIEFKLTQLRNCLSTSVPLRLLVPVLNDELTTKNENSTALVKDNLKLDTIEYYMQIIKMAVQNSKQEDILINIRLLKNLFMNLINMRTVYGNNVNTKKLLKLNNLYILISFINLESTK